MRFRLHLSTLVILCLATGALLGLCLYLYQTIPRDQNGTICDTIGMDEFYGALVVSALILPVTAVVCELWISLRAAGREARALAEDLKRDRSDS
ncbi:MAG: hypothetical protein HY291_02230 [Planctomycetes bacterium]|nr:hypothetical protein [Planctomycetota bacterium]